MLAKAAVLLALAALAFIGLETNAPERGLAASSPAVRQPMVATWWSDSVAIDFLPVLSQPPSSIRFQSYSGAEYATLTSASPGVATWSSSRIELTLPPGVLSGHLIVTASGKQSQPVELLVYGFSSVPSTGNGAPLAIATSPDGDSVWFNSEFHTQVRSVKWWDWETKNFPIPQFQNPPTIPGIFAATSPVLCSSDCRTNVSVLGEDIDVDGLGNIWLSQGGDLLYLGVHKNTSRVLRFNPSTETFACFNVPTDNAQTTGVLVDPGSGTTDVWYSQHAGGNGSGGQSSVTRLRINGDSLSNCTAFDPYSSPKEDLECSGPTDVNCHKRFFTLPGGFGAAHLGQDAEGNIWVTETFTNFVTNDGNDSISRLTPEGPQEGFIRLPIPHHTAGPPGKPAASAFGGFPWELGFDINGHLWVGEQFDAEITRWDTASIESQNCETLQGVPAANPCITAMYGFNGGAPPADGRFLHTIAPSPDGERLWYTVEDYPQGGQAQDTEAAVEVGFVSVDHVDTHGEYAKISLPRRSFVVSGGTVLMSAAGIIEAPVTRDVWIAGFRDDNIGHMFLLGESAPQDGADADRDGCADRREVGTNPATGGGRKATNFWDFFDTPDAGNVRNKVINVLDFYAVVDRFGSTGNARVDPLSTPPPEPAYHPAFDRSGTQLNLNNPNGSISSTDYNAVLAQFGANCNL